MSDSLTADQAYALLREEIDAELSGPRWASATLALHRLYHSVVRYESASRPHLSLDALDECLADIESHRAHAQEMADRSSDLSIAFVHVAQRWAYQDCLRWVQAARDSLAAQLLEDPA